MTGCEECTSEEIFVEDASDWVPTLPEKSLCRPCFLGLGR